MTAREAEEGESLDDKLSAEEPDVLPDAEPPSERPVRVHRGQIDGAPRMATRYSTLTGDALVVSRSVARNCIAR